MTIGTLYFNVWRVNLYKLLVETIYLTEVCISLKLYLVERLQHVMLEYNLLSRYDYIR